MGSQCQEFTAPGAFTFNVPASVSLVWVTLQAPGGAGSKHASGGGGGGGGELIHHWPYRVTPSGTVSGSIGAGINTSPSNDSTFGTLTAKGGGASPSTVNGGKGGGLLGAAQSTGLPGTNILDILGGSSGGIGNGSANNKNGGYCGRFDGGMKSTNSGGGGAAYDWGVAVSANDAATPAQPGAGAGGSGTATGTTAALGGNGYCRIEYCG